MAERYAAAATRVKHTTRTTDRQDDFHLRKETHRIGLWLFGLLAVIVGGLSLAALLSAFYHMLR